MSNIPADLQYTKEHEWVAPTSTALRIRMGITDYAQGALGDIVYVQMPKIVSEIFAPVTGTVVGINDALVNAPELINSDPYGAGWLVEIEVPAQPSGLLSAAEYGAITA